MEIQVNVAITPETIKAIQGLMKQGVQELEQAEERTQKKRGKKVKPQDPEDVPEELDETTVEDLDEEELDEETTVEDLDEEIEEEEPEEEDDDKKIDAKQLAQLKKALNSYSAKHGKPKAVKILHKYAKVSQDVKADDFSKVLKALKI